MEEKNLRRSSENINTADTAATDASVKPARSARSSGSARSAKADKTVKTAKSAKTAKAEKAESAQTSQTAKKPAPRRTKKQQGDVIFALDIGTRTVVGVLAEKTADSYRLIDMQTQAHESRSMTDGQIEDIDAVAAVVRSVRTALERRQSIKLQRVCIAAAGRALKTLRHRSSCDVSGLKSITAEDIRAAELEAVRSAEEEFTGSGGNSFYCVGHSVISLELDGYKVSKPEGHRGSELVTEVIAAFLPAYVVESLCAAVDEAGLETAGLTLEPIAAINAVVPKELRLINIAMCDIGAGTSDVAASRDGSIVAYGMATIAGDEMTESLMKQLLVEFNEAERIKTCTDPQTEYTDILFNHRTITREEVARLLLPAEKELADTVCSEILRANGTAPQAVFLVGGGSLLPGLPELVADGLGLDRSSNEDFELMHRMIEKERSEQMAEPILSGYLSNLGKYTECRHCNDRFRGREVRLHHHHAERQENTRPGYPQAHRVRALQYRRHKAGAAHGEVGEGAQLYPERRARHAARHGERSGGDIPQRQGMLP